MSPDIRYECALAAALIILEHLDASPGEAKHQRLAFAVFSILHAMDRHEEERSKPVGQFSLN